MSVNLSIKDVPDALAEQLRRRAAANHRSLQGELMAIIEAAANANADGADPAPRQGARSWVQGTKTLEQLLAERAPAGWTPHPSLAQAPLGVDIVRADRDSR